MPSTAPSWSLPTVTVPMTEWAPDVEDRPVSWRWMLGALGDAGVFKSVVLAVLGILLTRGGWAVIDAVRGVEPGTLREEVLGPGMVPSSLFGIVGLGATGSIASRTLADPILVVIGPGRGLFAIDGGIGTFATMLLAGSWAVVVWGLFGGAIGRIAAVRAAGGLEGVGMRSALGFSRRRLLGSVAAPIGMLLAIFAMAIPGAMVGLFQGSERGMMAFIGELTAGVAVLFALPMALLTIGLAFGWPLMILTVVVEGEDGFDAVSRSFSYLTRAARSVATSILIYIVAGVVGLAAVGLLGRLVLHLAGWSMAIVGPDEWLNERFTQGGSPVLRSTFGADRFGDRALSGTIWTRVVGLFAYGWAYSYVWSATARLYLGLRHEVDGTPIHDLYHPRDALEPFAADPVVAPATTPPVEGEGA